MALKHYFWHEQPAITKALRREFADCLGPDKLVVDVGAGYSPWKYATEFVDREAWPAIVATGKPLHVLDVELDRLPYADKSVDFLYCRHTVEDLHNPTLLLREINRVAKAGYIETPSPLAEMCRGVNQGLIRGYPHHHWFAWCESGALTLMPKLTAVEIIDFLPQFDEQIKSLLDSTPLLWNTYHAWRGDLRFDVRRNRFGFDVLGDLATALESAINRGMESAYAFSSAMGLQTARFTGLPSHLRCRHRHRHRFRKGVATAIAGRNQERRVRRLIAQRPIGVGPRQRTGRAASAAHGQVVFDCRLDVRCRIVPGDRTLRTDVPRTARDVGVERDRVDLLRASIPLDWRRIARIWPGSAKIR